MSIRAATLHLAARGTCNVTFFFLISRIREQSNYSARFGRLGCPPWSSHKPMKIIIFPGKNAMEIHQLERIDGERLPLVLVYHGPENLLSHRTWEWLAIYFHEGVGGFCQPAMLVYRSCTQRALWVVNPNMWPKKRPISVDLANIPHKGINTIVQQLGLVGVFFWVRRRLFQWVKESPWHSSAANHRTSRHLTRSTTTTADHTYKEARWKLACWSWLWMLYIHPKKTSMTLENNHFNRKYIFK